MNQTNAEMVESLRQRGSIESERVEKAFRHVDRKDFVPEKHEERAYVDRPLPIGVGQTISAPHMVARNTELLDVRDKDSVLEIGSGSGYQAAILSQIAEKVVGIEIESDLAEKSREVLESRGIPNVEIRKGVGLDAVKENYDRILYSCAINQEEFDRAKNYLEDDGVLVAPVKDKAHQVVKSYHSGETEQHLRVRFVEYRE